ncbi:MAG: hypothetical protein A3E26_04250 [Chlamydiae bacterium RIFCSPHIGHO2_12_FULL_49_32]|nr:MAG: hypothetical protein A3E26_04250 [Chlamydiae bacterium RIFCSPHIGHO2_12_FULL_49_32]
MQEKSYCCKPVGWDIFFINIGRQFGKSHFHKLDQRVAVLRGIRVKSKEELTERLYKYFDEINKQPVIFKWPYNSNERQAS